MAGNRLHECQFDCSGAKLNQEMDKSFVLIFYINHGLSNPSSGDCVFWLVPLKGGVGEIEDRRGHF